MLGARSRLEPGHQHGFDLLVGGVRVLAAKLGAPHRLAQLAQVEGRAQAGRERIGGVVGHGLILGSFPAGATAVTSAAGPALVYTSGMMPLPRRLTTGP
jgi:hypothetical protein